MDGDLFTIISTAIGTGMVASGATVAALRVHITYIKSHQDSQDEKISEMNRRVDIVERTAERAHHRIDLIEKTL